MHPYRLIDCCEIRPLPQLKITKIIDCDLECSIWLENEFAPNFNLNFTSLEKRAWEA